MHVREDEFYLELIESDSGKSIGPYLLGLINRYNSGLRSDPGLMTVANARAAILAGRFFGHQEEFREPLALFVAETEGFRKRNNNSYGDRLIDVDGGVIGVLDGLRTSSERGALDTLLTIGGRGDLTGGGRVVLYRALSERYQGHPGERDVIRVSMERFIKAETNPEVISDATRRNYLDPVLNVEASGQSKPAGEHLKEPEAQNPQESDSAERNSASEIKSEQSSEAVVPKENRQNGPVAWWGILLGSVALAAAILYKVSKKSK